MYITLPRGSAAETSRIFEFWLLVFWMETWDWEGEERGEEELQELVGSSVNGMVDYVISDGQGEADDAAEDVLRCGRAAGVR